MEKTGAEKLILPGNCFIIGEVAQAHDGSLGMAHSYIDAIADAGADAVKFQTHIAAAESTLAEQWRVKFSKQDATRCDYWKRMEFAEDMWLGLKKHADERGLKFISSPFSIEAVDLLKRIGVDAFKIASGEVNNVPFVDYIINSGLPVLLSTGMSPLEEIDKAVEHLIAGGVQPMVLQCTSIYPTPAEKVGLNMLPFLRERYGCPIGLSDHSGDIYASLAAVSLGAEIIEVHVAFGKDMFGPDTPASVTTSQLRQLVEGVRSIEKMLSNPVDKNDMAEQLAYMRNLFGKSIMAKVNLQAGDILTKENLVTKKPGTGISASRISEVIGRKLARNVKADEIIMESDLK